MAQKPVAQLLLRVDDTSGVAFFEFYLDAIKDPFSDKFGALPTELPPQLIEGHLELCIRARPEVPRPHVVGVDDDNRLRHLRFQHNISKYQ